MSENILEFNEVNFAYNKEQSLVLKNFRLALRAGEVAAVLGPNGTGKTTMLMLALGWLSPNEGQIFLEQKSLADYARHEIGRKISLVPQFEPAFFDFSLLDFALLGRAPYLGNFKMPREEDYAIAGQALEKVGMDGKAGRSVMSLSGGEKQLVLLARALTQQTDLLLLDEPTSHLDIKNKARLITIIRELVSEGKTIVFTTHEPEVAAMIAQTVVIVKGGQIMHLGTPAEVMTSQNLSAVYETEITTGFLNNQQVFTW
jgi:iron complex transport system ATP-binding protein